MVFIPYAAMKNISPVAAGNTLTNLANAARGAACNIYRTAPGLLTVPQSGAGDLGGVREGWRRFMDNMCDDGLLPPEPSQRLPNGQCAGTNYEIRYDGGFENSGSFAGSTIQIGPIGGVTRVTDGNGLTRIGFPVGSPGAPFFTILSLPSTSSPARLNSMWGSIVRVTALSGPDNCGGGTGGYPPANLPSGGFNPTVPVNDRGSRRDYPVVIPPIVFPVIGPNTFSPNLNVKIGQINFNFDLRGASILPIDLTVPITIGGGNSTNPNPNPPGKSEPGLDGQAIADRFDRLEDLIEELEECACPEVQQLQVVQMANNVTSFVQPQLPLKRNRYCAVALTALPPTSKRMNGENAPDVLFAGWAWFLSPDGYASERLPIDAAGKVFKNPGNFSSFAFTLQKGCRANAFELNVPLEE